MTDKRNRMNDTSFNNFLSDGNFNHGSLFSGIGGFDLAAQWMGWNNVFQVEIDDYCQKVLAKNFPNTKRYGDIKEFDGTKYQGTIHIVSGGFPCQPFSTAGRQAGKTDDRYLWPEMFRVISEIKPRFIVGENVYGIIAISLDTVLSDLETIGYTTETFIIPACAVNAPHRRDRVWIIAYDNTIRCNSGAFEWKGIQWKEQTRNETPSGFDVAYTKKQRLEGEQPARNTSTNGRGSKYDSAWTEVASEFCRVDDGLPNRVDRIKGLGNAVVPQVVYEIFKCINLLLPKASEREQEKIIKTA